MSMQVPAKADVISFIAHNSNQSDRPIRPEKKVKTATFKFCALNTRARRIAKRQPYSGVSLARPKRLTETSSIAKKSFVRDEGGSLRPKYWILTLISVTCVSIAFGSNPFLARTLNENGRQIDEVKVPASPPPAAKQKAVIVPASQGALGISTVSNIPAFSWCYGCSATAAAMIMGYYDNMGYNNMYAGPANAGVCPMNNDAFWGYMESPLSATHIGKDGRIARGNVEDYWIAVNNSDLDPYLVNGWAEHTHGDCTADYMGTSQYKYNNNDGSTTFYYYPDGSPLYDYTSGEPNRRDGCHGLRLFVESRGYTVAANFSQYIYGYEGNTLGFTYNQFKSEIDAGRPVMIHLEGHSMVGFGYNDSGSVIYIHDTWDNSAHSMTWGGTYGGMPHLGVTVLRVQGRDPQSLILSSNTVAVSEGGSAIVTVRLAAPPSANMNVTTVWTSGDKDLSVSSGASLTFTPQNWIVTQAVTLVANGDADTVNGAANFSLSCPGLATVNVMAAEVDDDARSLSSAWWTDKCFGGDKVGNAFCFDSGDQLNISVTGEGLDIFGQSDSGRFMFKPLAADCEVLATIPPIPEDALYSEWARVGLMMRGSTLKNAANIMFGRNKGLPESGMGLVSSLRERDNAGTLCWLSTPFARNRPARLRLMRQGAAYYMWVSTNSPAYDHWHCMTQRTNEFTEAMNVGVFVSRHTLQPNGPSALSCVFENVVARNLVTAEPDDLAGIAVNWIGDLPVTNGTVLGYTISRATRKKGAFAVLATVGPTSLSYRDTAAIRGVNYFYRLHALADSGNATNSLLIGTSTPVRIPVLAANPSPAMVKGIYAEYGVTIAPGTPVAARVDPNISNSWLYAGSDVYPPDTPNGIGTLDNFSSRYAGNLTVDESGCYSLAETGDDSFSLWIDGVKVIAQDLWVSGLEQHTVPVWLEAGRSYPVRAEQSEITGYESAILRWSKGPSGLSLISTAHLEPFPWPWQHRDIGDCPRFGNAIYDSTVKLFVVASGGLGVDSATGTDDSHFVWQTCETDFDLAARVLSLSGRSGTAAGLSVRSSNSDDAAAVTFAVVAQGGAGEERVLSVISRPAAGDRSSVAFFEVPTMPVELRLLRCGTNVWAYYRTASSEGWVGVTNICTGLSGTLNAGMTVFSGDITHTATGVFDSVSFFCPQAGNLGVTITNHEASVHIEEKTPMRVRQENDAQANVRYYWSDAADGNVTSYTVFRSIRPDQGFSAIGQMFQPEFKYTEPVLTTNTMVFYRLETTYDMGPLMTAGPAGLTFVSKPYGISDGYCVGTGTGLFAAFHRGPASSAYATNRPSHMEIRNLGVWDRGTTNTPMVFASASDDGIQVGPEHFQCSWSGWLEAQHTGFHWFCTQTDDATAVWVAGKNVIYCWGYKPDPQTSSPIWLEAGKRVPIYVYFQQGIGPGSFRMWWTCGYGLDGGYTSIPDSQLYPLVPDGTPIDVSPGSAAEFGLWRNMDIDARCPGYAVLGGTPESFDCTITGSGVDIWNTSDGFHFIYQEVEEDFEIEATFNSLIAADVWSKVGLMVRESTNADARCVSLVQSASNGRRLQLRGTTGGGCTSLWPPEDPDAYSGSTPVTLKLFHRGGKVQAYINGTHVSFIGGIDVDVSNWNRTLCVGIALTSHNNSRLSASLVTDVRFKIHHDKGSTLMVK